MAHGTCYGVDLRHVVQHIPSILLMRTCTTSQVWSFLTHLHVQEATVVFRIHFVVDENAPLRSRSFVQHLRTQVTCFFSASCFMQEIRTLLSSQRGSLQQPPAAQPLFCFGRCQPTDVKGWHPLRGEG
mmetsp:Transcript_98606/g.195641  ORF Transcript_98606/g.195641 Transcript_98606/m.195641 type:complete len:128 (+) Transcript_98606:1745-2128(+)